MKKIFLAVGDLSGDIHCGLLVKELLNRHPDWKIGALAGSNVGKNGAEIIGDTSGLGVIGFVSALMTVPRSLKLKEAAIRWIDREKPDIAVLCDWGGFNTRFIPELKKRGIPIFYYFPPRSWQKTGNGGLQIASDCQKIATPFEWSATRLQSVGSDATWVGHPILETLNKLNSRETLRREFGIADNEKLLALLPGSRSLELKYIAPHVVDAVRLLKQDAISSNLKVMVASAPENETRVRKIFGEDTKIVVNRSLELLRACDAAIVKSGTSTLEAAAADAPQIVVYNAPAIVRAQFELTGMRKKVPFIAMPNIIAGHEVVPELVGPPECGAQSIYTSIRELLESGPKIAKMREEYALVREALGKSLPYTATPKTADLIEEMLV
jgi:lipid-A-disaccharide synthase